jgi:hypothetical protein
MSNIIIPSKDRDYGKDCRDFCPLKDGTLTGDLKYCDRSLICKQTDVFACGYVSHWYKFRNEETGEESFDYFCTGMYPKRDTDDKVDKKVS